MRTIHIVFFSNPHKKSVLLMDGKAPIIIHNNKQIEHYLQRAGYRKNILMVNYRHTKKYVIADIIMKRKPKVIKDIENDNPIL